MKRLYILIPTLAIASALASACNPAQKPVADAPRSSAQSEGDLKNISGEELKAQIALGGKPSVVNLWATWCEPCRKEMPELAQFHKAAGSAVSLYLVSANNQSESIAAAQFLKDIKLASDQNYFYRIGEDAEKFGKSLAPTWSATLPTTFVFDAKGVLKTFWVGETTEKELAERLKKALAVPVTDPALQRHAK